MAIEAITDTPSAGGVRGPSGTETGWLDQAHLVAAGGEFTALVALDHHATAGFHADHPGTNPAQSGGFENLDHITGL